MAYHFMVLRAYNPETKQHQTRTRYVWDGADFELGLKAFHQEFDLFFKSRGFQVSSLTSYSENKSQVVKNGKRIWGDMNIQYIDKEAALMATSAWIKPVYHPV